MASESEIEEERRLFYVAMTRAKKVLMLSFAQTRMRNGKHESNSPSRFVREVDAKFIMNPLSADDNDDDAPRQSFGSGWGSKQSFRPKTGNTYGQSSRPIVQKREPIRPAEPKPVVRPVRPQQQAPTHIPSSDFVPTPILQLKAGHRVEHNRFGYGEILEISGPVTDLKAKILFDNHGEKILLLKYAKIRVVNNC